VCCGDDHNYNYNYNDDDVSSTECHQRSTKRASFSAWSIHAG